jgi:hypothetical protein
MKREKNLALVELRGPQVRIRQRSDAKIDDALS